MPKVIGTKKQKAVELYNIAKNGPCFIDELPEKVEGSCGYIQARKQYDLWVSSWVLHALEELIPELKHLKLAREERRRKLYDTPEQPKETK